MYLLIETLKTPVMFNNLIKTEVYGTPLRTYVSFPPMSLSIKKILDILRASVNKLDLKVFVNEIRFFRLKNFFLVFPPFLKLFEQM